MASSGGDGKEVEAKWLVSITNHVVNVHKGHCSKFLQSVYGPLKRKGNGSKKAYL